MRAREEYLAALAPPPAPVAQPPQPVRAPPAPQPHQLQAPPIFIIDAAFGFALGGLNELLGGDHDLGEAIAAEFFFGGHPFFMDGPLAAMTARSRDIAVAERQSVAAAKANSSAEAAAAYAAAATTHTDDPQNSHDTGVLANLRVIVDRLRAEQGESLPTLDDVITDIRKNGAEFSDGRPALVADAIAVAERTRKGERVVAIGATDMECLQRVWQRANDPRNANTRSQIRQAVFDALVDAWEPGVERHIVCVNGRTTRILAALVLLDWDERNWSVKSLEQFKNEVFARATSIIQKTAAAAATGTDPDLRAAAAAWVATSSAELDAAGATEEASDRLAEQMREAISQDIDNLVAAQGLKGVLAQPVIDAVRLEAQAAVM